MRRSWIALVVMGGLMLACSSSPPPREPTSPAVIVEVPPAAPVAESSAVPAVSATVTEPPASPTPPATTSLSPSPPKPASVSCRGAEDCWVGDDHQPIARPRRLRAVKFRPCKDGEHAPSCLDGVCVVKAYKC